MTLTPDTPLVWKRRVWNSQLGSSELLEEKTTLGEWVADLVQGEIDYHEQRHHGEH